jgi:arylsulfatase A-like enzyme
MAAKKKASKKGPRPNIIILCMDTQGVNNMSCYGYRLPTTPNLERTAAEGVLFERHFVTAPWTLPVHASLFTGRYASGHGAGAQHEGLEPGLPSLPEVLTRNGYRSVAFHNNRWCLDDSDRWNPGPGFEDYRQYGKDDEVDPEFVHDESLGDDSGSLRLVGVVKRWLEQNAMGRRRKPFFMYLNNCQVHDAYHPPEPFRSRFLPEGVDFERAFAAKGSQVDSTIGTRCPTLEEWHWQKCLRSGETACLDDRIGRLYDVLDELGLLDETLLIVFGDHGDSLGEHTHYSYHSQNGVWDVVTHTPLIMRLPGVLPEGERVGELVQVVDIFPMLLDLLELDEAEARESIRGVNLLGALEGPVREFAVMEAQTPIHVLRRGWMADPDCDPRFAFAALKAIRTKRFKYLWHACGQDMLFDVEQDPDERWNILHRKPLVARRLRAKLEEFLMSTEQRYFPDMFRPGHPRDPHVVRRLCAWGLYRPGIVPPWDPDDPPEL